MENFDYFECNSSILETTAYQAFNRLSFTFTKEHLENIVKAFNNPQASDNDKYVCACILKNAVISSQGLYPLCQDTGIANIYGWKKGSFDLSNAYNELTQGTKKIYDEKKLRFSTSCPKNFYDEYDPKNNMPAQISIFDDQCSLAPVPDFVKNAPDNSTSFIFCSKGGGSSNKTSFIQGTKAYLNKPKLTSLIKEELSHFGTSACPPYTIAMVVGGLSPEQNMLTLKLATMGAYDKMTCDPNDFAFRDKELEDEIMKIASETGYGAQFGGSNFALEAIVIRLPRHGASCPISFGVSCSAHRNLKVTVTPEGYYLEKTVSDPFTLPGLKEAVATLDKNTDEDSKIIDTNKGISHVLKELDGLQPGSRILLNGNILVARDQAHARWQKILDSGKELPEYTKMYPICYAGPARTPEGKIIGSFGPTTAGRMDSYADTLMSRGASLVTLAKGNRSRSFIEACKNHKAVYLGTPGGIAALIASEYITDQKIIDFEELGMEAVRQVTVKNLPCFVITDKNGNDFYTR